MTLPKFGSNAEINKSFNSRVALSKTAKTVKNTVFALYPIGLKRDNL